MLVPTLLFVIYKSKKTFGILHELRQLLEVTVVTEEFLELVKSYLELKCFFSHFIEFAFRLEKDQESPVELSCPSCQI